MTKNLAQKLFQFQEEKDQAEFEPNLNPEDNNLI
jgi:hypothetical protein